MKRKAILLTCATALFFIIMTVLSVSARDIHRARLPHVEARRLTRESFSAGNESMTYRQTAIPKELYHSGDVHIITSRSVNGENRDFAQKVVVTVGLETEGFYEVLSGIFGHDYVIFYSDKPFNDGDEVYFPLP